MFDFAESRWIAIANRRKGTQSLQPAAMIFWTNNLHVFRADNSSSQAKADSFRPIGNFELGQQIVYMVLYCTRGQMENTCNLAIRQAAG